MSHFAKVENGIVTQVIVIEQDVLDTGHWGDPALWIQTSYNTQGGQHILGGTPLRKNYAGVGYTYDSERDAFIPPQPYASWDILESDTAGNRGATLLAVNTWYHVAVSRSGSTFRSFVNGVVEKTFTSSAAIFSDTTIPYNIGRSGYSPGGYFYYNGYMDDLRITRGFARYTANFTPPTSAFLTT